MNTNAAITIRMGAAYNDMTIVEPTGESYFDFSTMTRGTQHKVRRMLTSALASAGRLARPKGSGFKKNRRGKGRRGGWRQGRRR